MAANRPRCWYRGSDILDVTKVGYRADSCESAPQNLFPYNTSVLGNKNIGHEGRPYGTELPSADKDAIIEYMKTL